MADREEEDTACRSSRAASGDAIGLARAGMIQASVRKKRIAGLGVVVGCVCELIRVERLDAFISCLPASGTAMQAAAYCIPALTEQALGTNPSPLRTVVQRAGRGQNAIPSVPRASHLVHEMFRPSRAFSTDASLGFSAASKKQRGTRALGHVSERYGTVVQTKFCIMLGSHRRSIEEGTKAQGLDRAGESCLVAQSPRSHTASRTRRPRDSAKRLASDKLHGMYGEFASHGTAVNRDPQALQPHRRTKATESPRHLGVIVV